MHWLFDFRFNFPVADASRNRDETSIAARKCVIITRLHFLIKLRSLTPEDQARQNIDRQLTECGWILQDMSDMNIMAGQGVAVREYQLTTGEADYGLYLSLIHISEPTRPY